MATLQLTLNSMAVVTTVGPASVLCAAAQMSPERRRASSSRCRIAKLQTSLAVMVGPLVLGSDRVAAHGRHVAGYAPVAAKPYMRCPCNPGDTVAAGSQHGTSDADFGRGDVLSDEDQLMWLDDDSQVRRHFTSATHTGCDMQMHACYTGCAYGVPKERS
jgi:hypothetical protein